MSIEAQAKPEDHQTPPKALPVHPQPEVEAAEVPENAKIQGPLTWVARFWLGLTVTIAVAVLANAAVFWRSPDLIKFGAFLAISLISAGARVRVPGVTELDHSPGGEAGFYF